MAYMRRSVACLAGVLFLYQPGMAQETGIHGLVAQAVEATEERRWQDAAEHWTRVVALNPTRATYWTRLSRARRESGDYPGAIQALEAERRLGARSEADITFDLARVHGLAGHPDQALYWLEKSFALGNRHHRTTRTHAAFAELQDNPRYRELAGLMDSAVVARDDGWRADIEFLSRALENIHYDFFQQADRRRYAAYRDALWEAVPELSDDEIMVHLMGLTRMAGDAHTHVYPNYVYQSDRFGVPVAFYAFDEGLFVHAAAPDNEHLLGSEVLAIEGRTPESVLDSVAKIVSRDNEMWVTLTTANLLSFPQLLHALGLARSADQLTVDLRFPGGSTRAVSLFARGGDSRGDWTDVWPDGTLRGRQPGGRYWYERIPELGATYFQLNSLFNGDEPLADVVDRLFADLDSKSGQRLVIDLRENRGGNQRLAQPLLHGLIARPRFAERGRLYVIVGRQTFSAAMYTAAQLERHLNPVFVGEPTGSRPNFVGETVYIRLPYSGLEPSISNIYWQGTTGGDYREWIGPHLYAPPSITKILEGIDPALEAIRLDVRSQRADQIDTP